MKRKVFGLIMAMVCVCGAAAQESDRSRALWGVRASASMVMPGKWRGDAGAVKMYNNGFGLDLGAVCNIALGRNFFFEPCAGFFYETYAYDDLLIGAGDGEAYDSKARLHKVGIRVPLMVGYDIRIAGGTLSVFTGPELTVGLGGSIGYNKYLPEELTEGLPTKVYDEQRRFDCAWKLGLGVPFNSWMVSLEGAVGMTDILKAPMKCREGRLALSVTYFL